MLTYYKWCKTVTKINKPEPVDVMFNDWVRVRWVFGKGDPKPAPKLDSTNSSSNFLRFIERELKKNIHYTQNKIIPPWTYLRRFELSSMAALLSFIFRFEVILLCVYNNLSRSRNRLITWYTRSPDVPQKTNYWNIESINSGRLVPVNNNSKQNSLDIWHNNDYGFVNNRRDDIVILAVDKTAGCPTNAYLPCD